MGPLDNKVKEPLTYITENLKKHRVMLHKSFVGLRDSISSNEKYKLSSIFEVLRAKDSKL